MPHGDSERAEVGRPDEVEDLGVDVTGASAARTKIWKCPVRVLSVARSAGRERRWLLPAQPTSLALCNWSGAACICGSADGSGGAVDVMNDKETADDARMSDAAVGDKRVISVGVIGCGAWGPNHIRVFGSLGSSVVRIAVDPDPHRLERVRQLHPSLELAADPEVALADPEIDAVVIATPTTTHYKGAPVSVSVAGDG